MHFFSQWHLGKALNLQSIIELLSNAVNVFAELINTLGISLQIRFFVPCFWEAELLVMGKAFAILSLYTESDYGWQINQFRTN